MDNKRIEITLFMSIMLSLLVIWPSSGYWEFINGKFYWFNYYSSYRSLGLVGVFFSIPFSFIFVYISMFIIDLITQDIKDIPKRAMIRKQLSGITQKSSEELKQKEPFDFIKIIELISFSWVGLIIFSYIFISNECVSSSDSIDVINLVGNTQSFFFEGTMYLTVFLFLTFVLQDLKSGYGRIITSAWIVFVVTSMSFLLRCHMP